MGVLNELIHSLRKHKWKKEYYLNCLHSIKIKIINKKELNCRLNKIYNEIIKNKYNYNCLKLKLNDLDYILDKILENNYELNKLKKDKKKYTQKMLIEKSKCQVLSKCIYYIINI